MDSRNLTLANRVYAYILRLAFGAAAYASVRIEQKTLAPACLASSWLMIPSASVMAVPLGASSLWMW